MAAAAPGVKRLALFVWLLVAFFYFYLSYNYIRANMNDRQFADYLQYVVQIAGGENRPAKEVRALILVKAEELSLPIRGEQITILGGGTTLNVSVNYDVDIEIPLIQRQIYTKKFEHMAKYQPGAGASLK
jgi:hypothetical protein